jgi:WhiB family redox-sensing transcriptional regulator
MSNIIPLQELLDVPSWYKYGECQNHDQDLFFPERGSSTVKAKAICNACPVQKECLDFAVERKERFGIWGGKSERERRAIRREQRLQAEKKKKN